MKCAIFSFLQIDTGDQLHTLFFLLFYKDFNPLSANWYYFFFFFFVLCTFLLLCTSPLWKLIRESSTTLFNFTRISDTTFSTSLCKLIPESSTYYTFLAPQDALVGQAFYICRIQSIRPPTFDCVEMYRGLFYGSNSTVQNNLQCTILNSN